MAKFELPRDGDIHIKVLHDHPLDMLEAEFFLYSLLTPCLPDFKI